MRRRPCGSPPNSTDSALTSSEVPDTLKGLQIVYSQMHVSRLLAKVLSTLRSQALDPDLAATGWTLVLLPSKPAHCLRTGVSVRFGHRLGLRGTPLAQEN